MVSRSAVSPFPASSAAVLTSTTATSSSRKSFTLSRCSGVSAAEICFSSSPSSSRRSESQRAILTCELRVSFGNSCTLLSTEAKLVSHRLQPIGDGACSGRSPHPEFKYVVGLLALLGGQHRGDGLEFVFNGLAVLGLRGGMLFCMARKLR